MLQFGLQDLRDKEHPMYLVQLPAATKCCSSKCKVQLDEFLINIIRPSTTNVSLLVFPVEFPRKRGALGFHASQCCLHQGHIHQAAQGSHPTALPFPRLWGKAAHPICFSWGWSSPLCLCTLSSASCPRCGKPRGISEAHAVTGVKSQAFGQFRKP